MLQLCMTAQPNFIVTTFIMIGKVIEEKPSIKVMIAQKENAMGEEGEEVRLYDSSKR